MLKAGRSVDPITMKGYLPAEVTGLKLDGEPAAPMQYLARLAAEAVPPSMALGQALAVHDMWIARQPLAAVQSAEDIILNMDPSGDNLQQLEPIEANITSLRAQRNRPEVREAAGQTYLHALSEALRTRD